MGKFVASEGATAVGLASVQKVGILGGTFDPIHLGHLAAAEEAREALGLTQVLFVPSSRPPHKRLHDLLPAELRYTMTKLACADNPTFSVSRVDMDWTGPTYTVDTLGRLQTQMPGAELYFITGADMFLDLPRWKEPETLLARYHFVGVARPGWDFTEVTKLAENKWPAYRNHIHTLNVPGVAVSATEIRQRVQHGRSIRYLVPDVIAQYVVEHGLYR